MDVTDADTIVGQTDGFRQGYVEGWAWRPQRPHEPVVVQMLVNGLLKGEVTACIPRPDLQTAGIGNGNHAFALPLIIEPDAPSVLRVVVRVKDGPGLPSGEFDIATSVEERADLARRQSVHYLEQIFGPFTTTPPPPRLPPPEPAPRLNFILYCATADSALATAAGMPEYSYYFVMRGFREVLRRLGTVYMVREPAREVDAIAAACAARGETCLFLSFAPPQSTELGLRCPTIPVIAWEFGTIPTGGWGSNIREDWRIVLRQCGRAITISDFAARALRAGMGANFPVAFVPTPVWDRLTALRARLGDADALPPSGPVTLTVDGLTWDSRTVTLSLGMRVPPLPVPVPSVTPSRLPMRGALLAMAEASAEAEARAAADRAEAEAAAVRPAAVMPPRKGLRTRLGITLRLARQWYREAVADAMPASIRRFAAALGRVARALRAPPLPGRSAAEIATTEVVAVSVQTAAVTAPPRYVPAPAPPPLAEPELACFVPSPYPDPAAPPPRASITLDGIIFTAVLSPKDGRKNWQDILTAFATSFRDRPEATLVLKMIGNDAAYWWWEFHLIVKRLPPFVCQIVVLTGFLEERTYEALIGATHFVVNASLAEGQCLPLVEFMSAYRPAIAPRHTAMLDYITADNALIVASSVEFCAWPHDPRNHLNTTRHRIEWASLRDAFTQAWRIATADPVCYAAMAHAAAASVRAYCADDVAGPRLAAFLGLGDEVLGRVDWSAIRRPAAESQLECWAPPSNSGAATAPHLSAPAEAPARARELQEASGAIA